MTRRDGERLYLRSLGPEDAELVAALVTENRAFFAPREPAWPPGYFTVEGQREWLEADREGATFGIFLHASDALVGTVGVGGVVRGPLQYANVGYAVGEAHNGRGYGTEAVRLAVGWALGDLGLHRVQAGVQPDNAASIRVLEKAGFREEGLALRYAQVAGAWVDCKLFAVTVEEWTS